MSCIGATIQGEIIYASSSFFLHYASLALSVYEHLRLPKIYFPDKHSTFLFTITFITTYVHLPSSKYTDKHSGHFCTPVELVYARFILTLHIITFFFYIDGLQIEQYVIV